MFAGQRNGVGRNVGFMARFIASSNAVLKVERNAVVSTAYQNCFFGANGCNLSDLISRVQSSPRYLYYR